MTTEAQILELPKVEDRRGNLSFVQDRSCIPFDIERVFWTYDVPSGCVRGGHAYKEQEELIIAITGSFDIVVTYPDREQERFRLNRSHFGVYLAPLTWRSVENFSTNAVSLHLSSRVYNAEDYVRDFEIYKRMARS